jgi:hypothetical protein
MICAWSAAEPGLPNGIAQLSLKSRYALCDPSFDSFEMTVMPCCQWCNMLSTYRGKVAGSNDIDANVEVSASKFIGHLMGQRDRSGSVVSSIRLITYFDAL